MKKAYGFDLVHCVGCVGEGEQLGDVRGWFEAAQSLCCGLGLSLPRGNAAERHMRVDVGDCLCGLLSTCHLLPCGWYSVLVGVLVYGMVNPPLNTPLQPKDL